MSLEFVICNAKCYSFLMSSVFVVWLVNDIVNELELSFFFFFFFVIKIFHQKGQIGQNMSLKIYNIFR